MTRVCLERSDDKLSSFQSGKIVCGNFLTLRELIPVIGSFGWSKFPRRSSLLLLVQIPSKSRLWLCRG